MIEVIKLVKRYGPDTILKGIDLEIGQGEFVAVVGGSGSGKSVLLRCLGMKEKWDAGQLIYKNIDLIGASPLVRWKWSKDWAVLDQTPSLLRNKTAYRNVVRGRFRNFPLWRLLLGGKASEDEHVRALDYLEQVGLLDKGFKKVEQLSGGEMQRVSIAKALSKGAKILIADDPVSNLDPHSAEQVLQQMRKLCDDKGLTIICVVRNLEWAERYGTRIIGLEAGELTLDVRGRRLTGAEKMKLV